MSACRHVGDGPGGSVVTTNGATRAMGVLVFSPRPREFVWWTVATEPNDIMSSMEKWWHGMVARMLRAVFG
jgi:hypothetical protein